MNKSIKYKKSIFESIYNLGEYIAEKYTTVYFINLDTQKMFIKRKYIDLWSVYQYAGDYNKISNHSSILKLKLSSPNTIFDFLYKDNTLLKIK